MNVFRQKASVLTPLRHGLQRLALAGAGVLICATASWGSMPDGPSTLQRTTSILASDRCPASLSRVIPKRSSGAMAGSAIAEALSGVSGQKRDMAIAEEIISGNIPDFLRRLKPVHLSGAGPEGRPVTVTLCVTPDYLSVGQGSDFLRVPMGLPAAAMIADRFGFLLPTTKMVDAIYAQAKERLAPRPMHPGSRMSSTAYFRDHNATIEGQRSGDENGALVAGHKKDIVLSNRMARQPDRVAIYGWHRSEGNPIQPLSTVHEATYADYSHGVRLVSGTAYVDGRPKSLSDLLEDPDYAAILSGEGRIMSPGGLLKRGIR
jgi:hypothetical protein